MANAFFGNSSRMSKVVPRLLLPGFLISLLVLLRFLIAKPGEDRPTYQASSGISMYLDPLVIRWASDPFRLLVHANPDTAAMKVSCSALKVAGSTGPSFQLFDDGTHGDDIPGDNIFTIDNVTFFDPSVLAPLMGMNFTVSNVLVTYTDGSTDTLNIDHRLTLRVIGTDGYSPAKITRLGPDAQMTDYCLNIVRSANYPDFDFDLTEMTKYYYRLFSDDRDFLIIEDVFQRAAYTLQAMGPRHEERGYRDRRPSL
jgi:hypothetical protein